MSVLTQKEINQNYYNKHKEKWKIKNSTYYAKNKEKCLQYQKKVPKEIYLARAQKSRLKIRYGITIEEYNNLVTKQNGVCAICKNPETSPNKSGLSVDHCHKTGKVRGLLCNHCNHGLGKFKDNIETVQNLLKYLTENQ